MSQIGAPRRDLTPLLSPRSIAIVGISQPGRFGGQLFQNLRACGYAGELLGVNPRYEALYDRPCYGSLGDLPERPDCALLAVPNAALLPALEEVAAAGVPAAVIFANAFSETGERPGLQDQLREVALANDLVVCGPNCMGFVAPGRGLAVSGYSVDPRTPAGNVTVISHSGSVWEALLQNQRGVAFNNVVSSGNEMVTTIADYMQFALRDPETLAIGLFLETVRDPETFQLALVEAADRDVPIVALKTGRSERGAELAQAHSGALAGEDGVYDALFARYGVCRARSVDELVDTLELFATGMRPPTRAVASLLDSGGQRALLVDLAEEEGLEFAAMSDETLARLGDVLEPGLEPGNPLDAWGTGNGADDIYAESLLALDADPATGLVLFAVDLCPQDDADSFYATIVEEVRDRLQKPLAFLGHQTSAASALQAGQLRRLGVPVLMGTETAVRAARHVTEYAAFQRGHRAGASSPGREVAPPVDLETLRARLDGEHRPLDEHASKALLGAYGLTVTNEIVASTLDEALLAAERIGYPLVVKTSGDLHKTERDGVRLGIGDADELSDVYRDFAARLGPKVLVQEMIPSGTELILGVVRDPQFGPLLTVGTGGIFVEVLKDVVMLMLPTTADAVREALGRLRGAALLRGARGRAPADEKAVVRAALGLAALAEDLGEQISEVDVNPLVALPDRAVVVDALVVPRSPR